MTQSGKFGQVWASSGGFEKVFVRFIITFSDVLCNLNFDYETASIFRIAEKKSLKELVRLMLRQKGWILAERGYQMFLQISTNFGLTLRLQLTKTNSLVGMSVFREHHLWITFRVFLSGESVKLETSGKYDVLVIDE